MPSLIQSSAAAYREYFTPEQKAQLEKIQTILIDVTVIADRGGVNAGALADIAAERLNELSYVIVRDPTRPHDVVLRMECEQRKIWEGTTAIKWQKEVRTEFEDAVAAAQAAQAADPGVYAMTKLQEALRKYEFALLLAAEWGHADRLLAMLDSPGISQARKIKIMSLLGEMQADEALPN